MASRRDLQDWVIEALTELDGSGRIVDVSRKVWQRHETELRASDDLFYTWQYDIRWAAQVLRNDGRLAKLDGDRSGVWRLP